MTRRRSYTMAAFILAGHKGATGDEELEEGRFEDQGSSWWPCLDRAESTFINSSTPLAYIRLQVQHPCFYTFGPPLTK